MSKEDFLIEEAKVEDAEAISEVIRLSWYDAYQGIEPQDALDEIRNDEETIPLDYLKDSI